MNQPATGIPTSLPISSFALPVAQILPLFVTLVFVVWALYTIVAFYHWIRFGDSLVVALGAMALHLLISASLAIYAVSAFA